MKDQRVLVTGGAGFIGSNLAGELALENEVVIFDDLSTGKMENITELLKKGNVRFVRGSITDLELLQGSFKDIDYEAGYSLEEGLRETVSWFNKGVI